MELTKEEFADLCSFLEQLSATMQQMSEHLMPEEGISCEMESERLWMEAEGFPDRFTLRFIVRQGRACEGNWRKEVLPPLRSAVRQIQLARVSQFSNS